MDIDHLLTGPVVFDSKTTFAAPQHFVKGCSYTVSAWVWLWPTNFRGSVFSTRNTEGLQLVGDGRSVHPSIQFNLNGKRQYFFGGILDDKGLPVGFYSSGDDDVKFMQWQHLALVISGEDHTLAGYMDGQLVNAGGLGGGPVDSARCPYGSPAPTINNTVLNVFSGHGSIGLVQDALVFRGEALSQADVQLLMVRRRPAPLPTLERLIVRYRVSSDLSAPSASPSPSAALTTVPDLGPLVVPVSAGSFPASGERGETSQGEERSNLGRGFVGDGSGPSAVIRTAAQKIGDTLSELYTHASAGNLSAYLAGHGSGRPRACAWEGVVDRNDTGIYFTSAASVGLVHRAHKLPDGSLVRFSDWEARNLRIQQELQDAATLWVSGRHADLRDDSVLSLEAWRGRYYERSFSALAMKVFISNDYYTLHPSEIKNDMGWPKPFSGQRSHGALMQLGYRAGFDMDSGLRVVDKGRLHELVDRLSEQHAERARPIGKAAAIETRRQDEARRLGEESKVTSTALRIPVGDPIMDGMQVVRETLLGALPLFPDPDLERQDPTTAVVLTDSDDVAIGCQNCLQGRLALALQKLSTPVSDAGVGHSHDASGGKLDSSENQCMSALIYYNPVAQFVVSHWDRPAAGNRPLERVRIAEGPRSLVGQTGRDDNLFVMHEMEAAGGNHYADVWLARSYFFGYHGVERNLESALRHFQRAAEAGNAEAQYNLGVFNDHGYANLPVNKTRAFEYFNQSAHHPREPFNMALEVMGNYHVGYNGFLKPDREKAKHFFERAASMGSPEAHYSLARLYFGAVVAEDFTDADIDAPQAMVHLARSVAGGNRRAMEVIAGAIFDPGSWLHRYEREQQSKEIIRKYINETHALQEAHGEIAESWHDAGVLHAKIHARESATETRRRGQTKHIPTKTWAYVPGQVIYIPVHKPEIKVALSFPLESSEARTGMSLCKVALTLMKMVAEHSSRPNELMREALKSFVAKDYYLALERYDEAAELGVLEAHENSIYLTNIIMERECGAEAAGLEEQSVLGAIENAVSWRVSVIFAYLTGDEAGFEVDQPRYFGLEDSGVSDGACRRYFRRTLGRRYSHLAVVANDPVAMRVIASELAQARYPFDNQTSGNGDIVSTGGAVSPAVYLHGYNAVQGDVYSLMYLGWAFWTGSVAGAFKCFVLVSAFCVFFYYY